MQRERGLQRVRDGKSLQVMWKLANLTNGGNDDLMSHQSTVMVPEDGASRAEIKV
jgi:hypothetical protein